MSTRLVQDYTHAIYSHAKEIHKNLPYAIDVCFYEEDGWLTVRPIGEVTEEQLEVAEARRFFLQRGVRKLYGIIGFERFNRAYGLVHFTDQTLVPPRFKGAGIVTLHNPAPIDELPQPKKRWIHSLSQAYYRRIMAQMESVWVLSERTKIALNEKLGIPEDRIRIQSYPLKPQSPIEKVSRKPKKRWICLARTWKEEQSDVVLKVHQQLQQMNDYDHELILVVPSAFRFLGTKVFRKYTPRCLPSRTQVWGELSSERWKEILETAAAILWIRPEKHRLLDLIEAMTNGVPVVSNTSRVVSELAGEAVPQIDFANLDQVKETLVELNRNPSVLDELGKRGEERVNGFYGSEPLKPLFDFYEEALKTGAVAPTVDLST